MQIFKRHRAIVPGHKVFRHQLPGFVNNSAIRRGNILCRIDIEHRPFLPAAFITECHAVFIGIRTDKDFPLFINRQVPKLLYIRDRSGSCFICFQRHTVSSRIVTVSCRGCDLLQIHRILRHDNLRL